MFRNNTQYKMFSFVPRNAAEYRRSACMCMLPVAVVVSHHLLLMMHHHIINHHTIDNVRLFVRCDLQVRVANPKSK
jgi:hypothetical protein